MKDIELKNGIIITDYNKYHTRDIREKVPMFKYDIMIGDKIVGRIFPNLAFVIYNQDKENKDIIEAWIKKQAKNKSKEKLSKEYESQCAKWKARAENIKCSISRIRKELENKMPLIPLSTKDYCKKNNIDTKTKDLIYTISVLLNGKSKETIKEVQDYISNEINKRLN